MWRGTCLMVLLPGIYTSFGERVLYQCTTGRCGSDHCRRLQSLVIITPVHTAERPGPLWRCQIIVRKISKRIDYHGHWAHTPPSQHANCPVRSGHKTIVRGKQPNDSRFEAVSVTRAVWLRTLRYWFRLTQECYPTNTKHSYNIYTTSAQRLRRWSSIV